MILTKDIKTPSNVKIIPFTNDLIGIMKDATLMVTRSGASTIAEITSIGLPSIMVPSPYVTNNHQYKNAKALGKGVEIIEEANFNKDTLIKAIDSIINDKEKLKEMKDKLLENGVKDSASKIYEEIIKLVKDE